MSRIINYLLGKGFSWVFGFIVFIFMWIFMWLGRVLRKGMDYAKPAQVILPLVVLAAFCTLVIYQKQYWGLVVLVLFGFGLTNHTLTRKASWD